MPDDTTEQLIVRPFSRTLTLSEVMQRIARFIEQIPSLKFVILTMRKGDSFDKIACARGHDMARSEVREMLRAALSAYDRDAVKSDPFKT